MIPLRAGRFWAPAQPDERNSVTRAVLFRSARGRGSGGTQRFPQAPCTPSPPPLPGLRARTRGTHKCVRERKELERAGPPCDGPCVFFGTVKRSLTDETSPLQLQH